MNRMLRIKELPERTGIKECTWRKWILEKRCPVPYRRTQGGMILVSENDLDSWLETLPVTAPEPHPPEAA